MKNRVNNIKRIVVTIAALGICIIVFFPIAYMISNSLKVELDIFKVPFRLIPEKVGRGGR